MRLEQFAMERMQSTYENQVEFNLSESGVHPLRIIAGIDRFKVRFGGDVYEVQNKYRRGIQQMALAMHRLEVPSIAAINMADMAKYPFDDESGQRNSNRLLSGDGVWTGIRMAADRFRLLYVRLIGASKPGTSRR